MNNVDEFTKELDALLIKYPNLPEMTLTIRPRVVIKTTETIVGKVIQDQVAVKPITSIDEQKNIPVINLEQTINKSKIAEMESMLKQL